MESEKAGGVCRIVWSVCVVCAWWMGVWLSVVVEMRLILPGSWSGLVEVLNLDYHSHTLIYSYLVVEMELICVVKVSIES